MHLVIFDIDGTILDSVNADDDCFIQTYRDLYQIDLGNADWNDFKNVTDSGLTNEIFEKWLNRPPELEEVNKIKRHFKGLLELRVQEFIEIDGALSFITSLSNRAHFEVGFATGGWKETALLKCKSIGLNLNHFIFKSSNDHFNRAKIIEMVVGEAKIKNQIENFETIVYFGDGLWDFKTTKQLGIDFIGIDYKMNNKLHVAGVEAIFKDYNQPGKIMNVI